MILSTHQPIFSPWLGFFYKMVYSDLLVLLDDAQFPRGTAWINRNRFKNHQGTLWITVPVWKKGKGLQKINEVKICYEGKWQAKHLRSLEMAYGNTPYWNDHCLFWEKIYTQKDPGLLNLNLQIIEYLKNSFMIHSPIKLSSPLKTTSTANERLIEICQKFKATTYLVQYEAKKYIQEELFSEAGIKVQYFRFHHPIYPQLWSNFISHLSAWDLLFNCGPQSQNILTQAGKKMRIAG